LEIRPVLLALWSEFGPGKWKKQRPSQLAQAQPVPRRELVPVAQAVAVPVHRAEVVEQPIGSDSPPRRIGTASHLRSLTLQERLQVLLGQVSALMDARDEDDWTINPAYHPDVNAYIEKHANFPQFVTRARALQKNRAPYYGKMVVPGPRRKTILSLGRTTVVE
jgi:hypothetical protein